MLVQINYAFILYDLLHISFEAYLINHSYSYTAAVLLSWFEYWIEVALFPRVFKSLTSAICLGLMLVIIGQARELATLL